MLEWTCNLQVRPYSLIPLLCMIPPLSDKRAICRKNGSRKRLTTSAKPLSNPFVVLVKRFRYTGSLTFYVVRQPSALSSPCPTNWSRCFATETSDSSTSHRVTFPRPKVRSSFDDKAVDYWPMTNRTFNDTLPLSAQYSRFYIKPFLHLRGAPGIWHE